MAVQWEPVGQTAKAEEPGRRPSADDVRLPGRRRGVVSRNWRVRSEAWLRPCDWPADEPLDGQVKCWGSSSNGQLGLGDGPPRGDSANEMGATLPNVDLGTGGETVNAAREGSYWPEPSRLRPRSARNSKGAPSAATATIHGATGAVPSAACILGQ
jgi:hypothetical protein